MERGVHNLDPNVKQMEKVYIPFDDQKKVKWHASPLQRLCEAVMMLSSTCGWQTPMLETMLAILMMM